MPDAPVIVQDPIEIEIEIPRTRLMHLASDPDYSEIVMEKPGCKITIRRVED